MDTTKGAGLIDLQIAHPRGQTAHEQQLRPAQKRGAPGQARGNRPARLRADGAGRPILSPIQRAALIRASRS